MIKLLQLILIFVRNSCTVVVKIKLNFSDSFEVLIHNTNITKFFQYSRRRNMSKYEGIIKAISFPLLLQSYPSGLCPYMHLQYWCSKIYHRLP
jgi:hypothetical protein